MHSSVDERLEELHVDQDDPFFFDHPLDHVPGMVLVGGLLDLAGRTDDDRRTGPASDGINLGTDCDRVRLRLRFRRMCELDRPVTLACVPAAGGPGRRWNVTATQGGDDSVCKGVVEFISGAPVRDPVVGRRPRPTAAPAHLVHRRRPENVLVGDLSRDAPGMRETAILVPPEEHPLLRAEPRFLSGLEVVEAGRQFVTMLEHCERGRPTDTQLLWLSLSTEIPRRIPRAVPLTLRWQVTENSSRRFAYSMSLVDSDTRAGYGTLEYGAIALGHDRYASLRSA